MTPGEHERAESALATASEALREADALLGLGLRGGASSRLYYAVFHAARGALASRGVRAKTHAGQRTVFVTTFGPAPVLARLLELRIEADYRPERFQESVATLQALVAEADSFVERCRRLVDQEVAEGVEDPDPPPDY